MQHDQVARLPQATATESLHLIAWCQRLEDFLTPAEVDTGAYTVENYPEYTGLKAAPADENNDPDGQKEMDESKMTFAFIFYYLLLSSIRFIISYISSVYQTLVIIFACLCLSSEK